MSKIEKLTELSLLFDEYNSLLTDVQRINFSNYYFEDMSLSEISDKAGNSRSSIQDSIKKAEEKLFIFEKKLNLVKKNKKILEIADKLETKGELDIANSLREI